MTKRKKKIQLRPKIEGVIVKNSEGKWVFRVITPKKKELQPMIGRLPYADN